MSGSREQEAQLDILAHERIGIEGELDLALDLARRGEMHKETRRSNRTFSPYHAIKRGMRGLKGDAKFANQLARIASEVGIKTKFITFVDLYCLSSQSNTLNSGTADEIRRVTNVPGFEQLVHYVQREIPVLDPSDMGQMGQIARVPGSARWEQMTFVDTRF